MTAKYIGQFLLEKGCITSRQLAEALEFQKQVKLPMGVIALEEGLLSSEQVKKVLARQSQNDLMFGEAAVSMGLLRRDQVDELLLRQTSHKVHLGEALIVKGFLSVDGLDRELKEFQREETRVARQLAAAFDSLTNRDIVRTFTDLMVLMLTEFSGEQEVKVEHCETGKENVRLFQWAVAQKMSGENVEFNCLLSAPPKLILQMASAVLDQSTCRLDDLTLDATKQFVNIANGNACAKLAEKGVTLRMEPPEIYETATRPYAFHRNDVVCVHLAAPDAKLEMAFEF